MARPKELTDAQVLREILARTRTTTRGASVKVLLGVFGSRANAFKRIGALRAAGLVERIPGSAGEYRLTPAGLARHQANLTDFTHLKGP